MTIMDTDHLLLLDADGAHAVFAALARLYGRDERPSVQGPLPAIAALTPATALSSAQRAAEREAARLLLDRLPFGIVVVDRGCRRLLANQPGGRMLSEAAFLRIEDDFVMPAVADDRALLEGAVQRACGGMPWPAEGVVIELRRADGHRAVRVLMLVLADGDAAVRGVVLLLPDEGRAHAVRRLLATLFGLTPAESHLAILMASGLSLPEAASERGITVATARDQWHNVMWKVNGGSGAPLLGLLCSALALPIEAMPGR